MPNIIKDKLISRDSEGVEVYIYPETEVSQIVDLNTHLNTTVNSVVALKNETPVSKMKYNKNDMVTTSVLETNTKKYIQNVSYDKTTMNTKLSSIDNTISSKLSSLTDSINNIETKIDTMITDIKALALESFYRPMAPKIGKYQGDTSPLIVFNATGFECKVYGIGLIVLNGYCTLITEPIPFTVNSNRVNYIYLERTERTNTPESIHVVVQDAKDTENTKSIMKVLIATVTTDETSVISTTSKRFRNGYNDYMGG